MKTLSGFHVCLAFSSILLSSLGVKCVAIQKRDTSDSVHIPLNDRSLLSPTSLGTTSEDEQDVLTAPHGISLNNTITTDGTIQAHTRPLDHEMLIGDRTTDTRSTTLPLTSLAQEVFLPSTKENKSQESGLLTTTITTSSPLQFDIEVNVPSVTVSKTTLGTPTKPDVSKSLDEHFLTKGSEEKSNGNANVFEHPPLSQFNTEEMLTTNPRTSDVQTGSDYSIAPLLFVDHSETAEHGIIVSNIVNPAQLTTVTNMRTDISTGVEDVQQNKTVQPLSVSPALEFTEDWDDTKLLPSSQVKVTEHETKMSVPAMSPETVSTDPFHGKLDLALTNRTETTTENMEKIYTGTEESTMLALGEGETSSEVAKADFGPTDSSTDMLDESILSTPLPSAIGHTSFMTESVDVPSVVSKSVNLFDGTRKWTEETASITTVTSSPTSAERTPLVASTKHLRVYGLKKLESEEGEEDEEEEEKDEEDEDDDDEEEDDDEKETDSVDDSVESDIEVPAFTLPVVASIKPLAEKTPQQALEEVSYRVPDTLEWEQQNLGLVRNWMERLKDKAGYMSGMLLPVGIGIAGAFFILGVLYSIKFMNRRRRLGFKRHKRKQREFNSMQDRVMLLADSSEDEF